MIRLAVIGDPIEHSLSPAVHGAALNRLGIEYEYKKVLVHPENLGEFVKTARAGGYDGFNLTMPHKVNILCPICHRQMRRHSITLRSIPCV